MLNHRRQKLIRIQLAAMNLSVLYADVVRAPLNATSHASCQRAAKPRTEDSKALTTRELLIEHLQESYPRVNLN